MNVDYAPPSKWSVLFYVMLLLLALIIFGCDNSTENEKPAGEQYEDRIIYKNNADGKYYSADFDGNSKFISEYLNGFTNPLDNRQMELNTIKSMAVYYDFDIDSIFIINYSKKVKYAANVDANHDFSLILQWMPNNEDILCYINHILYKISADGKTVITLAQTEPLKGLLTGADRINRVFFSPDNNRFLIRNYFGISIYDAGGYYLRYYADPVNVHDRIMRNDPRYLPINNQVIYIKDILDKSKGIQQYKLHLLELETGTDIQLTPDSMSVSNYAISPDGKYIVLTSRKTRNEIFLYNLQDGSLNMLTSAADEIYYLSFNKTGNKIIWNSSVDEILCVNIDGTGRKSIARQAYLLGTSQFVK